MMRQETHEEYRSRVKRELELEYDLSGRARRNRIAEMAMQGLLAGGAHTYDRLCHDSIASEAVDIADALIAELDK